MKCDKKPKTPGGRLAKLMEERNMTQSDLAEKLNYSRGYIDKWIHDKRDIPSAYAVKICDLFGVDLDYLLRGTPSRNITLVKDLGLSSAAIDYLKKNAETADDKPVLLAWYDQISKEDENEILSLPHDDLIEGGVACYPSDMLSIVNWLLSNYKGRLLLSMINSFVTVQCHDAWTEAYVPDHAGSG